MLTQIIETTDATWFESVKNREKNIFAITPCNQYWEKNINKADLIQIRLEPENKIIVRKMKPAIKASLHSHFFREHTNQEQKEAYRNFPYLYFIPLDGQDFKEKKKNIALHLNKTEFHVIKKREKNYVIVPYTHYWESKLKNYDIIEFYLHSKKTDKEKRKQMFKRNRGVNVISGYENEFFQKNTTQEQQEALKKKYPNCNAFCFIAYREDVR